MENIFWEIFKKTGNIDAFLAYKELNDYKNKTKNLKKDKEEIVS